MGAPPRPNLREIAEEPELPFAAIRIIAHREWRIINPGGAEQEIRVPFGPNYWHNGHLRNRELCFRRGLGRAVGWVQERMINMLQADDAWRGLQPQHRPVASELHSLSALELETRARAAGFTGHGSIEEFVEFLRKKRDVEDEVIRIEARAADVIKAAVLNVAANLREMAGHTEPVTHRTWNNGLVGTARSIARLSGTLSQNMSPAWTSGAGLLCGPNALAMSINAVRREYFGRLSDAVYKSPVTPDMLMGLLFQNAGATGHGVVGMPTAGYQAYLDERMQQLDDDATRGHEYTNMTRLNNLSIAQLTAMVTLAYQANLIEEEFSVGVVQGSSVDESGNVIPANVHVVHQVDDNAATVFLHHNMAASHGEYNHWEGFARINEGTDRYLPFEWGLSTPLALDTPAPVANLRRVSLFFHVLPS